MPFKLRLIKDFQKRIRESRDNIDSESQQQPSYQGHNHNKQKNLHRKRIIQKNYNIYQNDLRTYPLESRHIANFFNIIGINEEAVRSNDCPESYFRTLFYLKSVKKIQSRPNYLLLHLIDASFDFPPIEYIIQRFKSFGDMRFFTIATLIIQVTARLQAIEKIKTTPEREENSDFVEKYTHSLGNRMFVCRVSSSKMLISKSLLQQLEFNPEEFALQTLRFRTPIYEAASAEMYYDVVVKFLQNMINLLDLVCDKISLETFLDNSIMRFRDYFFTKKNKRLYCKMKTGMPHPLITIFEVEEIINRTEDIKQTMFYDLHKSQKVMKAKQRIQRNQINSVISLMDLPKNFLPQNQGRVPSYRLIEHSEEKDWQMMNEKY